MKCIACLKETENKKYCSRSCSVTMNNRQTPKRKRIPKICIRCTADFFSSKTWSTRRRYCPACEKTFEEHDSRWQKKELLKERGNTCEGLCKLSDWYGQKIPLQLDHIDGDTSNKKKENLRLLCGNCHMLTPTYAGKNAGKANDRNRKIGRAKYYKYVNLV